MDQLKNLGKRVRALRKARKMTQEKLSELAEMNPKYIGEIERAETNPTYTTLAKIAYALGISLSELFAFPKGKEAATMKETLTAEITAILKRGNIKQAKLILEIAKTVERCIR
ncbi:MAG: helix-turn-helix transcriptional regulator [Candidatus Edwardsbacteria bacterium]